MNDDEVSQQYLHGLSMGISRIFARSIDGHEMMQVS
jgi:hypothetical protein